jgi:hypothetical protein
VWDRAPGRQIARVVRWWMTLMLYGGFAAQILIGGAVFAFVAYALLAVLGWT